MERELTGVSLSVVAAAVAGGDVDALVAQQQRQFQMADPQAQHGHLFMPQGGEKLLDRSIHSDAS